MTSAQGQWWRRLHNWADVIHADFQTVISRVQQNISTYNFCTTERMLRTVIMQNSRLIQACFPIKINEVWIDRFCVRYDWWRRLQRTSSVSAVWTAHTVILGRWTTRKISPHPWPHGKPGLIALIGRPLILPRCVTEIKFAQNLRWLGNWH